MKKDTNVDKAYHKGFYEGLQKVQTVFKLKDIQFRAKINGEYIYSGTESDSVVKFWSIVKDYESDGEIDEIEIIVQKSNLE